MSGERTHPACSDRHSADHNSVRQNVERGTLEACATLRIGCVRYLNARPLIHGWSGPVTFDHPAVLCRELADGELDVALVSSFEFLRNPIYRIVDGISISSDGPVYSVVAAHTGEMSGVDQIELDPASETSSNLLRVLLAELGRGAGILPAAPAGVSPAKPKSVAHARLRLLIGDQAIHFRQEHANKFRFWDLGEAWKKLVDLPFVYALWLIRPEVAKAKQIADRLRAVRDQNLADLDRIIAAQTEFAPDFCANYFREHIRFNFGEREKEGLRTFGKLSAKHGLLPKRALSFELV